MPITQIFINIMNMNSSSSISKSFKIIPLDFKSTHTLPDSHTWIPSPYSDHHASPFLDTSVPVIDLSDPNAGSDVRRACEKLGIFQVTNHGVSKNVIKEAERQTRRLFSLPREQKLRALRSPEGTTGYGSAPISKNFPKLMWSEGFSIMGSPLQHACQLWPRRHTNFCNIMEEYQEVMKGLATKMIGLMIGSSLGSNNDVKWAKPKTRCNRQPQALLQLNSYPVCPDPTRAMGLAPHTDSSLLTLLNQGATSGLQVLGDGNQWVPVHPITGALVVNVGDLMHILSNGRYKSAVHRAVVNKTQHRISIAYFYGPPRDAEISPMMKFVDHDHPPVFRSVTWKEYLDHKATHFNKALDIIRSNVHHHHH